VELKKEPLGTAQCPTGRTGSDRSDRWGSSQETRSSANRSHRSDRCGFKPEGGSAIGLTGRTDPDRLDRWGLSQKHMGSTG
jgi:hypothetical protein